MPIVLPHRVVADGFNELAECRKGLMLFNRNDQYIGAALRKYGEYCKGEMDLFGQIISPGMNVVEGGANIGAYTLGISQMVGPTGRVFAFEPQRLVFQTLCANLALNSCANVHAVQAALGAQPGELSVPSLDPHKANNFGGLSLLGSAEGERTPIRVIDDLELQDCHFIKLDIEGMETQALAGGAKTVQAFRPIIYVENDRLDYSEPLLSLLFSWGYRLYWHITSYFSKDNFNKDQQNIFGSVHSANVLCIPHEKNLSVLGLEEITSAKAQKPGLQF